MPDQERKDWLLPVPCPFLSESPKQSFHRTKTYFIISSQNWLSVLNLTLKKKKILRFLFLNSRALIFLFLLWIRGLLLENGFLYSLYFGICPSLYSVIFFNLHVNVSLFLLHCFPFCEGLHCWLSLRGNFLNNVSCWHHWTLQSLNFVKTIIRSRLEIPYWTVRSSWLVSHLPTKTSFLWGNCDQQKLNWG